MFHILRHPSLLYSNFNKSTHGKFENFYKCLFVTFAKRGLLQSRFLLGLIKLIGLKNLFFCSPCFSSVVWYFRVHWTFKVCIFNLLSNPPCAWNRKGTISTLFPFSKWPLCTRFALRVPRRRHVFSCKGFPASS